MAYVTYFQYQELGYSAVPLEAFPRWVAMAEQTVRTHTFDRITDENITDTNRHGVCEIIDLLFSNADFVAGAPVVSFTNQHYSESYAGPDDGQKALHAQITRLMRAFFTREQLYRGAC